MSLSDLALKRPITMLMVYASLFVLGGIAFSRISLEFLPTMEGPNFWIQIPYRNATPTEVEKTIAVPAEELFETVPNLSRIDTVSQNSSCSIMLSFDWGTEMDFAYLEVRDRLERLKEHLPRESQDYFIWRFSSTDIEVMFLSFYRGGPVEELFEIVDDRIKPRLQRVEGVGQVTVWGHESMKVYIDLDQDLLKAHGISLYDLVLRLEQNNFTLGSGEVQEGGSRYLVRTVNEYRSLEDLENFRVNREGLRLKDVAHVRYGYPEKTVITRIDGQASISVGIKKESSANTVFVCEAVKKELDRILSEPAFSRMGYSVIFDQSTFILSSFQNLRSAGLWGGLFAVFVLYFFLRRILATCLVAVAIPISIMVAVMIMYFFSMTLNVISMVGLMLGVGMLVDNSIVVSENIFRLREQGVDPQEASRTGSREVAMAILASTLTTIIVFLPMVFMEMGILKVYTREVGIAISLSLLASLFVALTFIPLVAAHLPKGKRKRAESRFLRALGLRYRNGLSWALAHRSHVVCLLFVLIIVTVLVPVKQVPQRGEPAGDMRQVLLDVQVFGTQERDRIDTILKKVEQTLLSNREELEIDHIFAQSAQMANINRVNIFLREDEGSGLTTEEAERRVMEMMPEIPDVQFMIPDMHSPDGGSKNEVRVAFSGRDPVILEQIANEAIERIERVEGIVQAETDIEPGFDEIQVTVDRSLAKKYKVNPLVAAQTIAFGLRGFPMKKMKKEEKEMDVLIQLEKEDREDVSKLMDLQLLTEDARLIPLGVAARFREAPGQRAIRRSDGRRTVKVVGKTSGEALSIMKERLEKALRPMKLPPGYRMDFGQSILDLEKTRKAFLSAVFFSMLLIYFLLGALFESYAHPFTILVSVPLALVGSYWVMYVTGSAMDVAAYIGLILMVGIVVNNAIVIVDHMNQLRGSGREREEAILQAGQDRIRPVLMTAATTILGLVPLAFGGAGLGGMVMFAPLGKAVIGGLALSTLLTLFVVPVFYTFSEDAGHALRRLFSIAIPARPGFRAGQAGKG